MIALPLILLGIAWLQELIDQLVFAGGWNLAMGPGTPWWSLVTAPFSHGGFGHLLANTLVFLPLSYLVLARSARAYLAVWIAVILMAIVGIPTNNALQAASHSADITHPDLVEFDLNLQTNAMALRFSESVANETINVSLISLQPKCIETDPNGT